MVTQVVRYTLTPGQEPAFEEACRQASRLLESNGSCLGYSLTRATLERNRYTLFIYWDAPDGHQIGFKLSTQFSEYEEHLRPFAAAVEEDAHYRRTGVELSKPQLLRLSGPR